jgi:hypothetical protein
MIHDHFFIFIIINLKPVSTKFLCLSHCLVTEEEDDDGEGEGEAEDGDDDDDA